jgi:hypothetical protein
MARLKSWQIFRRSRISPNRMTVNDTPDNSSHPVTTITAGSGTQLAIVQSTTGALVLDGTPGLSVNLGTIGMDTVQGIRGPKVLVGEDSPLWVLRPLREVHRLLGVREGRCGLARDLTAKDIEVVRDPERGELLRGARELDHPLELGTTLQRTPREA